jgi:hypothetical protein
MSPLTKIRRYFYRYLIKKLHYQITEISHGLIEIAAGVEQCHNEAMIN